MEAQLAELHLLCRRRRTERVDKRLESSWAAWCRCSSATSGTGSASGRWLRRVLGWSWAPVYQPGSVDAVDAPTALREDLGAERLVAGQIGRAAQQGCR